MSEFSSPATLTPTGGSAVTFNGTANYVITNITGLDQAPIRAPIDNKPQSDGGLIHKFFYGPRHITVEGYIIPSDVATRNTREAALVTALDGAKTVGGTWTWTPDGGSLKTVTIKCDVPVTFTGGFIKSFVFGLVAGDPTIT